MKSIPVSVKKEVFLKIADYIGLENEELREKYRIEIEEDTETIEVTIAKLRKIAESYKIPISTFFLPEPPQFPRIESTRALKEGVSKDSKHAIREAFHVQGAFQEIAEQIPVYDLPMFTLRQDPKEAGQTIKEILEIDQIRKQCNTREQFFKKIREKLADKGILLLQLKLGSELRGFSISDEPPFIIVVDKTESHAGKIFTTFHELAHITVRKSRLDPKEDFKVSDEDELERWCEEFAAAVLLDETIKTKFIELIEKKKDYLDAIEKIANQFLVSKHAVAVELRKLEVLPSEKYWHFREHITVPETRRKGKGGPRRSIVIIYEKGERFVEEVVRAYERGKIDDTEASEILGTGEKVWQDIVSSLA